MAGALTSRSEDGTLILTLNNLESKNTLNAEICAAGIEVLNAAENNPEIRSVVITGAGGVFCTGADLQRLQASRRDSLDEQARNVDVLHSWIDSLHTYPKPVIAAVEGAAAGAGFSLALACDLIVAADNAVFVMSCSEVALSPQGGGSWSLARALPRALASELLLGAERISAARLHGTGLVNRVTAAGGALGEALNMAARLNGRAPNALASIKDLINDAPAHTLSQHLDSERNHFLRNLHHANGGEGMDAFLQKRPPCYR